MKLPKKRRLRELADKLWSKAVIADWGHKCAVCGRGDNLHAHHLTPRRHTATRYDLRNAVALCASHHIFDKDLSPHENAMGWVEWLKWHYPATHDWYQENAHPKFDGVTNEAFYVSHLQRLRQYVEPDDFERIVGVRFAAYLAAKGGE